MILSIRELVAFLLCSLCEQLKVEVRSSVQWPLSVPALRDDSRWQPDQVPWCGSSCRADSLCSGRTDSIYDSDQTSGSGIWMWLGDCCPRVPGPVPQSFRPRLFLREPILAHAPSDPRRSIRGSHLTKSHWLSLRRGRTHRVCHHHVPGHCQLLMEARSPEEQPANEFLCDRHGAMRQHSNVTPSLECALPPCAHVSVSLGPRQLFPSKHQLAHISISDGNEKQATPGRTRSLRVFRRFLQTQTASRRTGSHHSRKILPPCPRSSAAVFALGSTPSSRVHHPLVSAWKSSHRSRLALSLRTGARTEYLWDKNSRPQLNSVATENTTSLFTMELQCFLSAVAENFPQHFGSTFSRGQPRAGMAEKRRSCQDTQGAPSSVRKLEVDPPDTVTLTSQSMGCFQSLCPAQHRTLVVCSQLFGWGISKNTSLMLGPSKPWELDPARIACPSRPLDTHHEPEGCHLGGDAGATGQGGLTSSSVAR